MRLTRVVELAYCDLRYILQRVCQTALRLQRIPQRYLIACVPVNQHRALSFTQCLDSYGS